MALAILTFVNLSRQDSYLSVQDGQGELQFVTRIAPGSSTRQAATTGQTWNVVAGDSFLITAGDANRVYLISPHGVYEVAATNAIASEGGIAIADPDLQGNIGGGAPIT